MISPHQHTGGRHNDPHDHHYRLDERDVFDVALQLELPNFVVPVEVQEPKGEDHRRQIF